MPISYMMLSVVRFLILMGALFLYSGHALAGPPAGFGIFTGTETTNAGDPTDLNQSASSLEFSSSSFDPTYFSHSTSTFSHEITIQSFGNYRLHLNVPLFLQDTSGNRRQVVAEVQVNGVAVSHGRASSSYIRQASNHNTGSLSLNILLENLSVNDKVTVVLSQGAFTGKVTTTGAQVVMEYVPGSRSIFTGTATQTTLGTNLNQGGIGSLQWTESIKGSDYTHNNGVNPQNITLAAGDYMVYVNVPLVDSTCNGRTSPRLTLRLGGATVSGGTASQGYIRCLDTHDTSSIHWVGLLEGVTGGQVLTVATQAETTRTDAVTVPVGQAASIYIERVTSVTEWISLTGTSVLTGANFNPTIESEIQWNTQLAYDNTTFTHDTVTNSHLVSIANDGDYFLTYNDHMTSTGARTNNIARVKVNGAVVGSSVCASHYIRNSEGHQESSCAISQYLQALSAGDTVSVEMIAEATTTAVNDASPARLTLQRVGPQSDVPDTCTTIIDCTPDLILHYDGQMLSSILDDSNRVASDVSFDGTAATWNDISGSTNIHDGTQGSAASEPTFNTVTSGLTFDGNDYFNIANHPDLNTGTLKEKSIVAVFQTGADVTTPQVIYEEGGTVRGMNVYVRAGSLYIAFWNLANDGDGAQAFTFASAPVAANSFYYTSLVIDYSNYTGPAGPDGELRGHINGVAFPVIGTTTSLLYPHAGAIALGGMRNDTYFDTGPVGGNGNYFDGEIYEFLIYNHAITDSDAVDFYNYLRNKWPDPQPVTNLALTDVYTTDNTQSPQITWTASVSPDVNDYQTAVGTTAGAIDVQGWTSQGNVTSVNITGLTLSECVDYYASVKALDSALDESTVETTSFFRYDGTQPTDPSGIVISGTSSVTTSKTFTWTSSTDACSFAGYDVSIGLSAGVDDVVAWTDIGNVLTHTFTGIAPNLVTATDYYFNIRARDEAGNVSSIVSSASWQVDTCVASDVTNPTDPGSFVLVGDGGPTTSPNHTWTASTDACGFSHYEVGIGTSAGATDVVGFTDVGDVLTYKFFGISPSLAANTNYFTTIRGVDLAGNFSNQVNSSAWQLPVPGGVSAGLVLWLDADDAGTLYTDNTCSTPATLDNDPIGCWQDKSTTANNALAAGGARPTLQLNEFNNQSVLRFDGANDALDYTNINTARTVFVVNKSDTNSFQQILGHTTSQDFYTPSGALIDTTLSNANLRSGSWRVDQADVSSPTTFTQTGSYSLISVVATGNVETDHLSSDRKVGGRFFNGDIVEVIIYDRALNSTEIGNVETYLFNKWFTAIPPAVTDLAFTTPYTTSSSQSPVFTWTDSTAPDLNFYEVALGTSQGSNDISGWTNIGLVSSYQFLGQSLVECQDVYASVRAVDTDSFTSAFASTNMGSFDGTAPSLPSSLILSGTASPTDSRTLTWSPSADNCTGTSYEVALGTTAGGNDVIDWTATAATTYEFTSIAPTLSFATDYYLSVRAVDDAGNTTSAVSSASWQLDTCIASDVTNPTDPSSLVLSGSGSVTRSPSLNWSASTDACSFDHYEIGIGTSNGGVEVTGYIDIGNVLSHQFTNLGSNLAFSTNYFLTVKGVDSAGNESAPVSSSSWQLTSPGNVSPVGLELWLDADDSFTLFQDAGCSASPVLADNTRTQCVRDKSGSDNHATNSSPGNSPMYRSTQFNGKPTLYFNGGVDEYLTFNSTINTIRTVFWVIREDSSNPGNTAFLLGNSAGATFDFHRDSTSGPIFSAANASTNVTGGTLQLNTAGITGTTTNMPTTESVLSLVTTGNTTADSFSQDRTGCCASRTWGGFASEIIIFNRALSALEVTDVENYLMLKWGITASTTTWLGTLGTDWFNPGNWSNGVPSATQSCVIPDQANDPIINGTGTCNDVTITTGNVTLQAATNSTLAVFGDFNNSGTIAFNDGQIEMRDDGASNTDQSFSSSSTIGALTFNKTAGGSVSLDSTSLTISSLDIPSGSFFTLEVPNGNTLNLPTGMTQSAGIFDIDGGATVNVTNGQTIAVNGGTFQISGTNDVYPQTTTNKGTITSAGRWSFVATAGNVSLTGFLLDRLDVNGFQVNGTTNLTALDGGQFTNLVNDFVTPVRALVLNTTSSLTETLASNVGFSWSAANATYSGIATPTDNYFLVYADNCNNSVLVFDQWFGDFWGTSPAAVTEDKLFDTDDGETCQISMDIAASPVHLVSFDATPYDQQVVLDWETGSELNHLGFNVYRSDSLYGDYQQLNQEMIQNFVNTTSFRGTYRYVDSSLTNDQIYYYMIEDVALNGERILHGPVAATPTAILGPAPDDSAIPDTNVIADGNDTPSPNTGVTTDESEVLTETLGSLRVRIRPSALSISASAWDGSYRDLRIPGYGKTLEPGQPEMLYRRFYIEVQKPYNSISASVVGLSRTDHTATLSGNDISPAPTWALNGSNVLKASYAPDAAQYLLNQWFPSQEHQVLPETIALNGKHFVQIDLWPARFNPVTDQLDQISEIIFDINLEGSDWEQPTPLSGFVPQPDAVANNLVIEFNSSGVHQFSYADLVAAEVEGPFDGESLSNFRLYHHGKEIPLEVVSGDANFNAGDLLRFYVDFSESLDAATDQVVLSTLDLRQDVDIDFDFDGPQRITSVANGYANQPIAANDYYWRTQEFEQNLFAIFDVPLGDRQDHIYWQRIFTVGGSPTDSNSTHSIVVDMSDLHTTNDQLVKVHVDLRGRGVFAQNPKHNLEMAINAGSQSSQAFEGLQAQTVTFTAPSYAFNAGSNTLDFTSLATFVNSGDYDLIDINRVRIEYPAHHIAQSNRFTLETQANQQVAVENFTTTNLKIYDVSHPFEHMIYQDFAVNDYNSNYLVQFDTHPGLSSLGGRKIHIIEDGNYISPVSLKLSFGSEEYIKDPNFIVDHLILAPRHLLGVLEKLVEHRQGQGFNTKAIALEQVYAEFSGGRKSSQAIRDLMNHLRTYPVSAPRFLLLVGDATYDPKGQLNSYGLSQMPVVIQSGLQMDFASDTYFIQDELGMPQVSVGRLPSSNELEIEAYINKMIAYENGVRSPSNAKTNQFISGVDTINENFNSQIDQLQQSLSTHNQDLLATKTNLADFATDPEKTTAIQQLFDQDSLITTYYGHGAENLWGSAGVFSETDALALTNNSLPIVLALNCLNAYYYDIDASSRSIGESFIFNENGGAVAFWGSTSQTSPIAQLNLATSFMSQFAQNTNQSFSSLTLGELILQAKQQQGLNAYSKDTVESWTLFGDPALVIPAGAFSPQPQADPAVTVNPAPASGGGGGCGAFAAKGERPFDLGLLFLELLFFLIPISITYGLRRRSS